ncbi:hypothetical protein [Rhodoblastus sp.]
MARLTPAKGVLAIDLEVPHEAPMVAEAMRRGSATSDVVVVYGAAAIADRADVLPRALELARGTIKRDGRGRLLVDIPVRPSPRIPETGRSRQ